MHAQNMRVLELLQRPEFAAKHGNEHAGLDEAYCKEPKRCCDASVQAPEAFNDEFSAASEVYSFSIIAWKALTGDVPWEGYSEAKLTKANQQGGATSPVPSCCCNTRGTARSAVLGTGAGLARLPM